MSNESKTAVVVAWHCEEQIQKFLKAWGEDPKLRNDEAAEPWLILQRDARGEGCALTKNAGIRNAILRGFEVVVVLDDDCFPETDSGRTNLIHLMRAHENALQPQTIRRFRPVTTPPSRGTPYKLPTAMPVAASMGFWSENGDYDACAQLVRGAFCPMEFHHAVIHGEYFPLCGMNIAFRPREWFVPGVWSKEGGSSAWWEFVDVPRFDDIWMGWLWQREAYRRGYCFNLNGPIVRHSRQSNVWQNLRDEAKHLERNETLWHEIATHPQGDYESLRKLLPV